MKDNFLYFSLYLNIVFFAIIGTITTQIYENMNNDIQARMSEVDKYQQENIVLLGDSITDWYPINEMFNQNIPIINSGLAGKKTDDILEKLPELVYRFNPTKVFILIGTNDLNVEEEYKDIENTILNIKNIVNNINENRKFAKIFVQSIYPVNKEIGDKGGYRTNEEIKFINNKLKLYCEETQKCNYIDMYNLLIDENDNLNEKYTVDGLHISSEGYKVITKELEKRI